MNVNRNTILLPFSHILRAHVLLLCFFAIKTDLAASHIVGGEMTYRCLGNQRFEISLIVYRDCRLGNPNVWFDNPAIVGVYNAERTLETQIADRGILRMSLRNVNDTLRPILSNPCYTVPPSVCVHRTIYRDTLTLPFKPGGYQLVYQRCCRNMTIQNIISPEATGATFLSVIGEEALNTCNSSPVFNSWPPIYICRDEAILFDHSASDIDADSLSYRLCNPLQGGTMSMPVPNPPSPPPYDAVIWNGGFSGANMLGGTDPLRIDPLTGILQGTPELLGQFVVGICVDEFRSGTLISTTRRDFQYNVGECGVPTAAFFLDTVRCNLQLSVRNQGLFTNSFRWVLTQGSDTLHTSVSRDFNYQLPATGSYRLTLIAAPGNVCADTFSRDFIVLDDLSGSIQAIEQLSCGDSISLQLQSEFTASAVSNWTLWHHGDSTEISGSPAIVRVPFADSIRVRLLLQSSSGCSLSIEQVIFPKNPDWPEYEDSLFFCPGEQKRIELNTSDLIEWQANPAIVGNLNSKMLALAPTENTLLHFTIKNDLGCEKTGVIAVFIKPGIPDLIIEADPPAVVRGRTTQLRIENVHSYNYSWSPSTPLDRADIHDPTAVISEETQFFVLVTNEQDCERLFDITVRLLILQCDEAKVFIPNAFTPNGDGVNDRWLVRSLNLDRFELKVYDRWGKEIFRSQDQEDYWDGTYRGTPVPKGSYGFYFEGECVGGEKLIQKGNVTVF